MTRETYRNKKAKGANWVVQITLLLSLFGFAGYERILESPAKAPQVELIASLKKNDKRTTSFKLCKSKKTDTCLSSKQLQINASLFTLASAIKTRLATNFNEVISFERWDAAAELKYTPRSTEAFI